MDRCGKITNGYKNALPGIWQHEEGAAGWLSARVPAGWRRSPVQAERKWQQPADLGTGKCSHSGGHKVAVLQPKSLMVVAYGKGSPWTVVWGRLGTATEVPERWVALQKIGIKTDIKLIKQKVGDPVKMF